MSPASAAAASSSTKRTGVHVLSKKKFSTILAHYSIGPASSVGETVEREFMPLSSSEPLNPVCEEPLTTAEFNVMFHAYRSCKRKSVRVLDKSPPLCSLNETGVNYRARKLAQLAHNLNNRIHSIDLAIESARNKLTNNCIGDASCNAVSCTLNPLPFSSYCLNRIEKCL